MQMRFIYFILVFLALLNMSIKDIHIEITAKILYKIINYLKIINTKLTPAKCI